MAVNLTSGAISILSSSEWSSYGIKPVLQIIDVRTLQTQSGGGGEGKERYRVSLSDGMYHQQGMLSTQKNDLVRSNQLQKGSIIRLTEFVCNQIRDRVIVIIIDLDLVLDKCEIIGDPKLFPAKSSTDETSSVSSAAPIQSSLNQPTIMVSNGQSSTGQSFVEDPLSRSVTRPGSNLGPPVQTANLLHSARSHSYGNSSQSIYNPPPPTPTFQQTHVNNRMQSTQTVYNLPPQHPPVNNRMQPPPPMYGNRGPMAKNEAQSRVIPIAALNPYQGRWTIKARVTVKGELRRYNNAKGDGKVFSFDLLDSNGGEIRVTCFNAVADQFYDQIEVGKVYFISRGSVKPAQKAFNHLNNDHEITLDHTSTIQPCFDDDTSIPSQQYHFRPIIDIENMDNNSVLDIIGVVCSIKPVSLVTRKAGGETQKQELSLKDMSGRSIECTLWGNFCNAEGQKLINMCDSGLFPVLAVKSARVNEYNGKSIGTISLSQLSIDPDLPEARKLRVWYDSIGKNAPSVSMSQDSSSRIDVCKTISQIKDENLGTSEKADIITVHATIWHMKVDSFCYTACPIVVEGKLCNKKVVNNGDGKWRGDKCDHVVDECEYRYILQLNIQDHTGSTWTTAFQEGGDVIMGVPAKELHFIKNEEQDENKFAEIVRNALFGEYSFRLRVKEDTYNDEQRIKSTVTRAEKINFSSRTKFLLQKIEDPSSVAPNHGVSSQIGTLGHQQTPSVSGMGHQQTPIVSGMSYQQTHSVSSMGYHQTPSVSGMGHQQTPSVSGMGHQQTPIVSGMSYQQTHFVSGMGHQQTPSVSGMGYQQTPSVNGMGHQVASGRFDGGMVTGGGSDECYKCHGTGHWARDCPGVSNVGPPYGSQSVSSGRFNSGFASGGASGDCYKCHQPGHWARDCPGASNVSSYGRPYGRT
ncbi:replication protein A 70 kDa DNA-binding subunit A-like [Rutidosis leptorrhynchoides]|uniref:replication protein A 70 kDa DNA-binding subunit A-like n=1 Tax=Rutidosis leptorrhynchoides TaxID=125765 RepID=UPI003A9974AF